MPQRTRDFGVAALALVAIFGALAAFDERVPGRIRDAVSDVAYGRWTAHNSPLGDFMASVSASPAVDNVFVAALLVTAVVLLFLMVRAQ